MPFPIEQRFVADAEAELGVRFPPGFVARMCAMNGGELAAGDGWHLIPFSNKASRKLIKRTAVHIVLETLNDRERPDYPEGGVTIGDNGTPQRLLLLPRPDLPGWLGEEIHLWDPDIGTELLLDSIEEDNGQDA